MSWTAMDLLEPLVATTAPMQVCGCFLPLLAVCSENHGTTGFALLLVQPCVYQHLMSLVHAQLQTLAA